VQCSTLTLALSRRERVVYLRLLNAYGRERVVYLCPLNAYAGGTGHGF